MVNNIFDLLKDSLCILKVKYACIYELFISTDYSNPTQHETTLIGKRKQNDDDDDATSTSGMHC